MNTLKYTLTPAQQALYDWIKAYALKHGKFPTFREMAEGMKVTVNAIVQKIGVLLRKGSLVRNPKGTRMAPYSIPLGGPEVLKEEDKLMLVIPGKYKGTISAGEAVALAECLLKYLAEGEEGGEE